MLKRTVAAVLCLLLAISAAACGVEESTGAGYLNAIPVKAVEAGYRDISRFEIADARLVPLKEAAVAVTLPGVVAEVFVETGQHVHEGDMLFRLKDEDLSIQVKQAEAALDAANTALAKIQGGSAKLQIEKLRTALATAEINYEDAVSNYETTKKLYDEKSVSEQSLNAARTRMNLAEEQYEAAKESLRITRDEILPESVSAAQAQVRQAEIALEAAGKRLKDSCVYAPWDGIVTMVSIECGEAVSAAVPAVTLVDISGLYAEAEVTDDIAVKLKAGVSVQVRIPALDGITSTGRVHSIIPSADRRTRLFLLRVKVPQYQDKLLGGMPAQLILPVEVAMNVLAVPISAIQRDKKKGYVYVTDGSKVEIREIITGLSGTEFMEVVEGLENGEMVVTEGSSMLSPDSVVEVVGDEGGSHENN